MIAPATLRLDDIHKSYEEGGTRHPILSGVSTTFEAARFSVLLGRSGSGKSTILNLLAGIDAPDAGRVFLGDDCLTSMDDEARTLLRRRRIGIVFQFFNLIPTLSAAENVALPAELAGVKRTEARSRAGVLLERVGLASRGDAMPDRLSGGEQQRVAIARALAHNPSIIIADEPTGNLDTDTGADVLRLLVALVREEGLTMIMATHNPEVVPHADHVYMIEQRRLRAMTREDVRRELIGEVAPIGEVGPPDTSADGIR